MIRMLAICILVYLIIEQESFGKTMTLKIQFPPVAITPDPHAMEDAYSMFLVLQIHRGLFRYTPQGEVLPDLVRSWNLSADKKTYVFQLNDATFSDGTQITADDVVNSFARIFKKGASIGADIDLISGVKELRSNGDLRKFGVRSLHAKSVEFRLSKPSAIFFKQLAAADCAILKILPDSDSYNFDPKTPTSGPYKLSRMEKQKITLQKWRTDNLDSKNPPEFVDISLTSDDPVKAAMDGKLDVLDREALGLKEVEALLERSWHRVPTEVVLERFLVVNPNLIPIEVRKLMFALTDQQSMTAALNESRLVPAYGLIPYGMSGSLSEADVSGLRTRNQNHKLPMTTIRLAYNIESDTNARIANWLKKAWEASGMLHVEIEARPGTELLEVMFRKTGEILIGSKGLDYFDGYSVLSYFRSTYESNYFFVKNHLIDKLLNDVAGIESPVVRTDLYKKIQLEILQQYTVIPLTFGSLAAGLWGPETAYVPPHPGGMHTLPLETVMMK